ncbi:PREDICTED: uncharacterized protein LOC101302842 [Fragaria vesca subsp. vesca]|uniref:uncharacterized protein LOC101302842 n=1 Tax=Fragaria vesca subsp. vesca TaxID=101020 RepID=UPI0002C33ABF|nr:PREDICTED: uncharacterized protein LOC101302842 [Fragaria vesca subsp. vesca]
MVKWSPHIGDVLKVNFDGSVNGDSTVGSFVIRNPLGKPLAASALYLGHTTVPVAEASALRSNLLFAKEKGFVNIKVEGDSKLVIDSVNGSIAPPWRLLKIVEYIRALAFSFTIIFFKHVFREINFVVDALANLGHKTRVSSFWNDHIHCEASNALVFDSVNLRYPRGTSI